MCMSCGCRRLEESHNDERNITVASLQRAADASGRTIPQVIASLADGIAEVRAQGIPDHQSLGQAVNERISPD